MDFKQLWLEKLPDSIRYIVICQNDDNTKAESLAILEDRVHEVISKPPDPRQIFRTIQQHLPRIAKLSCNAYERHGRTEFQTRVMNKDIKHPSNNWIFPIFRCNQCLLVS